MRNVTEKLRKELNCPRDTELNPQCVESLSEYIDVISSLGRPSDRYWFRGQSRSEWALTPSALRHSEPDSRQAALNLIRDFQRVAETKLDRLPAYEEKLKWMQLAQHYGVPTRLLDWTESALFALFFAVYQHSQAHGVVWMLRPTDIKRIPGQPKTSSLDAHLQERVLEGYFNLGANERKNGRPTIAIRPVWNSARLMVQRGTFTLHGSRHFTLDSNQARSLVGLPILAEVKEDLRLQLEAVGIDEMALFPELEHTCKSLLRRAGLEE